MTVWLVLGAAALIAGFAKTAIGGLAVVAVALVATVIPARESTAALLLLLLVGDALAVTLYGRDCDWSLLRHLVPAVLPGLALGAAVLAVVDDHSLRIGIGLVLLVLASLQLVLQLRPAAPEEGRQPWSWPAAAATGVAAGTTTMAANAGGPVMALYLIAQGVDKRRFLGTSAWFFLGVNLSKLPFSVGLGLIDAQMLRRTLILAPLVVLGGLVGRYVVRRIGQRSFETAVLAASVLSAVTLLVR